MFCHLPFTIYRSLILIFLVIFVPNLESMIEEDVVIDQEIDIDEDGTQDSENELFEHFRFVVDKGQTQIRIDKFLTSKIPNVSRNKIQTAADAECILVNEKPVKSSYKVKPSDIISIVMNEQPREIEMIPEDIPLNVVYEDDDIILVNKEPGMVVHPSYGHYTGTLINAICFRLKDLPLFQDGSMRPGLIHRIDKNTSGILLLAKNDISKNKLGKQFFDRTTNRKYVALVWGNFDHDSGTVTGNIGRNPKNRKIMHVFPSGEVGKTAITHYKVIERLGYVTLIECKLETGRTHQIRAHMQFIGHPLFNDEEYGGNEILKGMPTNKYRQFVNNCFKLCPRQALHAKSLGFTHPSTGKEMFFDSEIPSDMTQTIDKWRNYIEHKKDFEDIES